MPVDRAEQQGLGIAVAGHVLLFAALSLSLSRPPEPLKAINPPIEVSLVDLAPESSAPVISEASAAQSPEPQEVAGPPEPTPAPPAPRIEPAPPPPVPRVEPRPVTKPEPKPLAKVEPKPAAKPTPKPAEKKIAKPDPKPAAKAPAKTTPKPAAKAPAKPTRTSRLDSSMVKGLKDSTSKPAATTGGKSRLGPDFLKGLGTNANNRPSEGAPAKRASAQVKSTFDGTINGQIRPHWRPPNGVDVEQLLAKIEIRLNRDGTLANARLLSLAGKTEDNAPQQARFVENAIKAVRLAAPFNLPADYYDDWQVWSVDFSATRGVR